MERLVLDYLDGRWPGAPPESEELTASISGGRVARARQFVLHPQLPRKLAPTQEIYAEGPAHPGHGASEARLRRFAEEVKRCEHWAKFLDGSPARRTLWEGFKKALLAHYTETRAGGLLPPGALAHLTNHSFLVSGHKPARDAPDVPEQSRHGDLRAPGVQCGVSVSGTVRARARLRPRSTTFRAPRRLQESPATAVCTAEFTDAQAQAMWDEYVCAGENMRFLPPTDRGIVAANVISTPALLAPVPELEKYYFRDATFRRGWICYMEGGRLHSPELQAAHHPLLRRRHLRQLHAGHAAGHHLPSHPRQGGGPSAVLSLHLGVRRSARVRAHQVPRRSPRGAT